MGELEEINDKGGAADSSVQQQPDTKVGEPGGDMTTSGENRMTQGKRIGQSCVIIVSFVILGLLENAKGPALLDISEFYEIQLDVLSGIFVMSSIGSVIGSFFTGWVLDYCYRFRCLILFIYCFGLGVVSIFIPFMGSVYALFALMFVNGFFSGSLDTGGNVLCLDIWRGLDGGPWMHAIHFGFSIGAFASPLVAAPFLGTRTTLVNQLERNGTDEETIKEILANSSNDLQDTQITYLFPILGIVGIVVSLGYLYYGITDLIIDHRRKKSKNHDPKLSTEQESAPVQRRTLNLVIVVVSMALFFFLYVGAEVSLAIFLTPFAVECDLHLTKIEGARLTAIFWGSFALMRFVAIFAAMKLNPLIIMIFSFVLCVLGSGLLVLFANTSHTILQISSGVLGVGAASIYATGLLWLESYIIITSKIGSLFTIMSSLGPDVFPVLVGQFIVDWPMFIMYVTAVIILLCIGLFAVSAVFGKKVLAEKARERKIDEEDLGKELEPLAS